MSAWACGTNDEGFVTDVDGLAVNLGGARGVDRHRVVGMYATNESPDENYQVILHGDRRAMRFFFTDGRLDRN